MIQLPQSGTPRCTATVELLSRHQRPYLFSVTVTGEPPHAWARAYTIAADSDNSAAIKGMELFVDEVQKLPGVGSIVPKARLA